MLRKVGEMQIINNIRLIRHSLKVAILSCALANKLKIPIRQCKNIFFAGLLHDIGKLKLNQNILYKKDELTVVEFEHIKQHVTLGAKMLCKYRVPEAIVYIIEQHHERDDGTGYPNGLKCDEISIEAKILRYADVYDALTSNRVYRRRYTKQQALDKINTMNII